MPDAYLSDKYECDFTEEDEAVLMQLAKMVPILTQEYRRALGNRALSGLHGRSFWASVRLRVVRRTGIRAQMERGDELRWFVES